MSIKSYNITVTIQVSTMDSPGKSAEQWAKEIATKYSNMATDYASIGADKIVDVLLDEIVGS